MLMIVGCVSITHQRGHRHYKYFFPRRTRRRSLFNPLAKVLVNKFGKTEQELADMKQKLDKATSE
jgi:hypothetical protein